MVNFCALYMFTELLLLYCHILSACIIRGYGYGLYILMLSIFVQDCA